MNIESGICTQSCSQLTERCSFCPWPATCVTGTGDPICESHSQLLTQELERRAEANALRRADVAKYGLATVRFRADLGHYRRESDAWKANGPPPAKRGERTTPTGESLRLVRL